MDSYTYSKYQPTLSEYSNSSSFLITVLHSKLKNIDVKWNIGKYDKWIDHIDK